MKIMKIMKIIILTEQFHSYYNNIYWLSLIGSYSLFAETIHVFMFFIYESISQRCFPDLHWSAGLYLDQSPCTCCIIFLIIL